MRRRPAGMSDWHLFNRASRRMALFRDDVDCRVFVARLRKAAGLSGVVVWAYTLMTNHFHLVVRGTSAQLTRFAHHLQRLYALYHNQRYGFTGHAFEGPYGVVRQAGGAMLLRTLAYVFSNPVTAGLCDRPEAWTWTSYRSFMGLGDSWRWMSPGPLLKEFGPDPTATRRRLVECLEKTRARGSKRRRAKGPSATEVHADQFQWLLERAVERRSELEGHDPVMLALTWAHDVGILRSAIALVLGGPVSGAMRSKLWRFREWLTENSDRAERLRFP